MADIDTFDGAQTPPFRAGKEAPLSINPEHTPAFRPESRRIDYSIVVPVYNEQESLKTLLAEILTVVTPLNSRYEIIFVNDGSCDQSPQILEEFIRQLPEVIRVVHLKTRSGQTYALREGFQKIQGNVIITMDADLQNDPADIPRLLKKMDEGYDCVCGWRRDREDAPFKAWLSKSGNVLQRAVTRLKIHDVSCTLRAYKKGCLRNLHLEWEGQHRFIPLMLSLEGYKIGEIVSRHRRRQFGKTKYNHHRIFRVVGDFLKILSTKELAQ